MLLSSKTTDLDWYYSRPFQKLKSVIRDLLYRTFVKTPLCIIHKKVFQSQPAQGISITFQYSIIAHVFIIAYVSSATRM